MIKIIKGTYGYRTERGIVKPKTAKDGPFSVSPEREAELVAMGVAEYAQTEPQTEAKAEAQEAEAEQAQAGTLDPAQLKELTNAKLKELAEDMGIDTKDLRTKASLIGAIVSVDVEAGESVDEDEIPKFDAASAVK